MNELDPLSVPGWLTELGQRLARHRLNRNWGQAELARRAGVSVRTLSRLENGEATQLENFLRVLEALDLLAGLERMVPGVPASPLQQLDRAGRVRQRASGSRVGEPPEETGPWRWGDEE